VIETPVPSPQIDYEQMPLFSGFICDQQNRRVASAFVLRVRSEARPWSRYYSHAYLVTALHAVYDKSRGVPREGLTLEFPWMEEQGLARTPLVDYDWQFMRPADLPDRETALDIAVAPLRGSGFTGLQFGRSLRAVDLELCVPGPSYDLLGLETASAGLFVHYSGNTEHIDPILRFGQIAALPRVAVRSEYGVTEAVLVESSSGAGMSGAPVFVREGTRWSLLGVHVGHYLDSQRAETEGAVQKFDTHASVGIVAPAWRIRADLLRLVADHQRETDAEIDLFPWRFVDRRHRELRGVVLSESFYQDMTDYTLEEARHWDYLFYRPRVTGGFDARFSTGAEFEWNEEIPEPLAPRGSVVAALQNLLGSIAWSRAGDRLQRGTVTFYDETTEVDLFLDPRDQVRVIRLTSAWKELDRTVLEGVMTVLGGTPLKGVDLHHTWEI
jgi:hypothetical protein